MFIGRGPGRFDVGVARARDARQNDGQIHAPDVEPIECREQRS